MWLCHQLKQVCNMIKECTQAQKQSHQHWQLSPAGGSLAVTFWPSQVEEEGPWQRLAALSTNKPKAQLNTTTQASAQVCLPV